jgi:hypothetical protein
MEASGLGLLVDARGDNACAGFTAREQNEIPLYSALLGDVSGTTRSKVL